MIGEERHDHDEPTASPGLPPEPGIAAPGETEAELVAAELREPDVAAVNGELEDAYEHLRHAEEHDRERRREERQAADHERRAREEAEEAERHEQAAGLLQRRARSAEHVITSDGHVLEVEPLQLTGETAPAADGDEPHRDAPAPSPRERDPGTSRREGGERSRGSDAEMIRLEETVDALPALARVAAVAWLRAAAWGVGTSLRAGARLARAAADPESAAQLYDDVSDGVRAYAREFLGISELDERVRRLTPLAGASLRQDGPPPQIDLRAQGEELLRQAADVGYEETAHPAYARILSELAPDEARILRLLAQDGPQAVVDVRANNLIGLGSQLVAPGLNMLGAQAGLRWRERVPAYLNNLARLGLVYVSEDPLRDQITYQVLEAQPDVLAVIRETPRAKTVHRSLRLTPFGQGFCSVCLPLDPVLPGAEAPGASGPTGGSARDAGVRIRTESAPPQPH